MRMEHEIYRQLVQTTADKGYLSHVTWAWLFILDPILFHRSLMYQVLMQCLLFIYGSQDKYPEKYFRLTGFK